MSNQQNLILSVKEAFVTFGKEPLFEDLSFNIRSTDKICIIGKNGVGKTTLMHMISGFRELDAGERWSATGLNIGYLHQKIDTNLDQTIAQYIFAGLKPEKQNDEYKYMIDMVADPLELDQSQQLKNLSGGQLRRTALARSLVEEPDILLLDEPTNHLDLHVIQWLENYLRAYNGALLCISHDRTFLKNISDKVFWLDRGKLRICPKGYSYFDEWSSMLLDQEARELFNRQKILNEELEWSRKGVKARRKRNMRRLGIMQKEREKLQKDQSSFRKAMTKIDLEPVDIGKTSKVLAEFFKVNKNLGEGDKKIKILENFNLRIMKGQRIGILGKNGSGKSSFLKLLVKEMSPDSGKIKLAKNIEISYFDQSRSELNLKHSLWKTLCPGGGDYINVNGKSRHVCGYLKDFMFDPKNARDLVSTLSGGQQNRLMLAKILANPSGLLILDEPTNDLDMDTLDMLEEILCNYTGTMIIVSHDRDFLDQTVSSIIAFEGDGNVELYAGGYSDYMNSENNIGVKKPNDYSIQKANKKAAKATSKPEKLKKLSYKLQYELDNLPNKIAQLEQEIKNLQEKLSDNNLYMKDPQAFDKASRRIAKVNLEIEAAELRWLELSEM